MHQLRVIEDEAISAEASVGTRLGADTDFRREPLARDALKSSVSLGRRAQAVVAVAVPHLSLTRPVALLVDDDGSARRRLTQDLAGRGFDVEASDDTNVAIAAARRRRPALVVLELRLRSGSGLDLLARLRPDFPATPFVILTHYGSVASAVRAMRLGATNYLCKPAAVTEVLRAAGQGVCADVAAADEWEDAVASPTMTLDEAIWEYIHRTVEDAGSLSEAARRLGLWRQSLKRMISKYRPSPAHAPAASVLSPPP